MIALTSNALCYQVAYIYPDYFTAIVGTFKDGVLVAGRATSIKSISQQKVVATCWLK